MKTTPTKEQLSVLNNDKKNLIVSASAGSGKTFVVIKYLTNLIIEKKIPVKRLLVLTFTRAAAGEMRERLNKALIKQTADSFLLEQIDDLSISDICTIDAFCEKLVKQNLDRLDIDEGFRVMEDASQLKTDAFENAITEFEKIEPEALQEIYYSFRKNKKVIFDTLLDIDAYFSAVRNAEDKIDYYINNQPQLFENALELLNKNLIVVLSQMEKEIDTIEGQVTSQPKYVEFCKSLKVLLAFNKSDNFADNIKTLNRISLPNIPVVRGEGRDEGLADLVKVIRTKFKNVLDDYSKFQFSQEMFAKQQGGSLAVALLKLYQIFNKCYLSLKRKLDVVDFVDIENFALSLMQDENILLAMQEKYDYIFVDEYQDTNRIQEAIIKPITAKGHFVAVGDPKQGIYGFRNATMEIMQQDVADFSAQQDGGVAYLRSNFRSDNRLLSFINRIFEKVMTTESVGIDYSATSLLRGEMPFEKMALPSVRVDIVDCEDEEERCEKQIYSVKDDKLWLAEKNTHEVETIIARIDELLVSQIYDEKNDRFRKVEFDDIAILLRNRGSLMSDLALALAKRGYPVLSDEKRLEVEEPEVQMLINLCKLLLNKDDDVALVSVMSSYLGGFTLDDLALLRLKYPEEKGFYAIVNQEQENPQVQEFLNMLKTLFLQAEVNGLYYALNDLFAKKNYFAYLKYNGINKLMQVNNFLQDIKQNDFDFNIAEVVSYFTEVGGKKRNTNVSGSGSIKLMTIHASKGLEYPIVILAGAGQKLEKPNTKSYLINSEFGLGTYIFDEKTNTKFTSPVIEVIKKQNHKKDMIDEIMIFYVALTRAKNHLYIVGQENINNLILSESFNVLDAKNYLSLIGFAFGKEFVTSLLSQGTITAGDWQFNHVTEVREISYTKPENTLTGKSDEKVINALNDYFNFNYYNKHLCKINLKNTVTGLNSQNKEEFYEKIVLDETEGANFIEQGNAYHEALKLINFEKVFDMESLEQELTLHFHEFTEGYLELIDKNILLKNILLIKNTVKNSTIYKEKQFVMSASLKEIIGENSEDEVLVQGVVDMFAIGEKNILIDYKFTQEKNPKKILNKYSKQLDLYTLAIEKGFNIKIDKKYILSLKNAELIEYFK